MAGGLLIKAQAECGLQEESFWPGDYNPIWDIDPPPYMFELVQEGKFGMLPIGEVSLAKLSV